MHEACLNERQASPWLPVILSKPVSLASQYQTLIRKPCADLQDTREGMLAWLALALQSNAERGKMQMDPRKAANHSFFISLNAVLLKLCEPFLEPLSGKAWGKVDPR